MKKQISKDIISIVVPVYNAEKYISKCIDSIIAQTYSDMEIILVDDGSTDNSGKICDAYAKKDFRIRVIHKTNSGPVNARKTGINIAVGKYIGFVDADDYIDAGMYQKLYETAEQCHAEFVHSGYYENSERKILGTSKNVKYYKGISEKETLFIQLFSLYPDAEFGAALWPNLFKKNFILKIFNRIPDSQTYGEDLIAMCLCIMNANHFVSIPDGFYHYITRTDSLSHHSSEKRLLEYYELYHLLKNILETNHSTEDVLTVLKKRFCMLTMQLLASWNDLYFPKYKYPAIEELKNKKIILYGAGKTGQDYYHQICKYQCCTIVSWIDREKRDLEYAAIEDPGSIQNKIYDNILIAVFDETAALEIKNRLILCGIDEKKILWKKAVSVLD